MPELQTEDPADFTESGECPACKAQGVRLKNIDGILVCERCAAKRFSSKVRKTIQEAFDRQQAQRQRDSWRRRLAIAKKGMALYESSKFGEAMRIFSEYLSILERHHGVGVGGLRPTLFNDKTAAVEILLITGIYWDLAKIYDRVKGKETEMRIALNKYVEFSADRKHLILASEAMRRYIDTKTCIHKDEFRNAHRVLRSHMTKCFIASVIFGPGSREVAALCAFRDRTLAKHRAGRALVSAYYRVSPPIACALLRVPPATTAMRAVLQPIARTLGMIYKVRN